MTFPLAERPNRRKLLQLHGQHRRALAASQYPCFQNYYHALGFLNPNPQFISNVKSTINHWQLRDLVQIDAKTGMVYHTFDDAIRVLPLLPRSARLLTSYDYLRLPYFPRCFNHAPGGLVVAGGVTTSLLKVFSMKVPDLGRDLARNSHTRPLKGLFSFKGPNTKAELTFQLGEMINNAVTIYPQANTESAYTLYVCNNDSNMYVVDVSDSGMKATRAIACEANTSLNNVHQSPDGRLLTATGDSGSIFLMDPTDPRPKIKTIRTTHDSGFGISYHHNQHTLATAFQDGTCSLYDLRRLDEPIHEIKSTRAGHQSGAFRCCKFLSTPLQDLLVVSEQVGRVHLMDFRQFSEDKHQVVVFPFALDQFGRYKHQRCTVKDKLMAARQGLVDDLSEHENERPDNHKRFDIYDDESAQFSAPLVYDYSYLTDVNPKLFKDYEYHPEPIPVCEDEKSQYSYPRFNNPQWSSAPTSMNIECLPGESFDESLTGSLRAPVPVDPHDVRERLDLETGLGNLEDCIAAAIPPHTQRYCQDSYQQSVNNVHGEMEISGVDWFDNQLYIGCEDGGLFTWDVNVRARRSFSSCSYI